MQGRLQGTAVRNCPLPTCGSNLAQKWKYSNERETAPTRDLAGAVTLVSLSKV